MSDFTYVPSFSSQADYTPRVKVAKFGEGYEQRVGEGINIVPQNWKLLFANRSTVDGDAIISFLVTKAGLTAFTWTPKTGVQIKVVCRSWSRIYVDAGAQTISCLFEQVFEQ
jgi:phage-related protein